MLIFSTGLAIGAFVGAAQVVGRVAVLCLLAVIAVLVWRATADGPQAVTAQMQQFGAVLAGQRELVVGILFGATVGRPLASVLKSSILH